jgi:hypothetical protein
VAYVGTAYVAGERTGLIREDELAVGQSYRNTYEQSKAEAEALVRSRFESMPGVILRPSIIVGDSQTGATSSFKMMYWPLKIYARRLWRTVPGYPDAVLDIVPVDYVAAAVPPGLRPCRDRQHCPSLRRPHAQRHHPAIAKRAAEYFNAPEARYVDPKFFFAAIRPLLFATLWGKKRRVLRDGRAYRDYFTMRMQFDTTNADRLLGSAGIIPRPSPRLPRPPLPLLRGQRVGPQAHPRAMSLYRRFRLSRDRFITVANLLDELLRQNGDCEVSVDERGPHRLAEIHAEVCAMDAFLRSVVAIRPGQLVAIYRTNDVQCFHWFLAIVRAGGIAVPLNPMLTVAEVHRILTTSGAEILITDTAIFARSIQDRGALPVQTWIQSDDEPQTLEGFLRFKATASATEQPTPPAAIDPAATIAIFHTSGTSGFPKGAALSSRALLGARASTVLAGLVLGSRDLAFVALPWSHIMAVSIALYGLMAGIRGCFLERFDARSCLDLIERYRVTAVVGVPAMFTRLVNSNPAPARLKSVRLWLSASDHLPAEIRERLRTFGALARPLGKRIPPVLVNGYGMVELGGLAMMGIDLSFAPGSGDVCFPFRPSASA